MLLGGRLWVSINKLANRQYSVRKSFQIKYIDNRNNTLYSKIYYLGISNNFLCFPLWMAKAAMERIIWVRDKMDYQHSWKKKKFLFISSYSLSHVRLFVTPWIVAHQALPSMGFSRQEYWSGLPFPFPTLMSIHVWIIFSLTWI